MLQGCVARYDEDVRLGGRLQSLGSPRIETLSAIVMSSDVSILATCPEKSKPSGLDKLRQLRW